MIRHKINISIAGYTHLFSALVLLLYNFSFMSKVQRITDNIAISTYIFVCIYLVFNAALSLVFWQKTTKTISYILIFFNSIVAYFMITYNTAIDMVMLLNIIHTDIYEASSMLSKNMLFFFFTTCLIPAFFIARTNITFPNNHQHIKNITKHIVLNAIVLLLMIAPIYKIADNFYREQKHLRYYLLPTNYIGSIISFIKRSNFTTHEHISIADDIKIEKYWHNNKKNLIVLVVGETARAANFSLGGYERQTNEELYPFSKNFVYFKNFYACGTSTAISVPCMLSPDSQKEFKPQSELYKDNITNIMEKAQYKSLWRENNTGCQDTCKRIETEKKCKKKHCYDEILLDGLNEKVKSIKKDVFLVLHQRGSHGPDYYNMYPKNFEKYQPICAKNVLNKCSQEELINVFDNTIEYTSYFLKETINQLEKLSDKYNIMLMYASDHGESLGENNLYLHSTLYSIAPEEQKHIPALIWFPASTQRDLRIDINCLKEMSEKRYSHDNIFHTILGFAGAKTSVYNKDYDILAQCTKN